MLLKGCETIEAAPRCALRLADLYFDRANYAASITYLNKSMSAFSKPQPDINGSYLYLLRAMSNTSILLSKVSDGDYGQASDEIVAIYRDFNTALANRDLPNEYRQAAETTIKILESQSNVLNVKRETGEFI